TMLGGALAAGGANAINCFIDRDIDQLMHRTRKRSLPAGRVSPRNALIYGVILGVLSFVVLATHVNLLSAVLAQAGVVFFVPAYVPILPLVLGQPETRRQILLYSVLLVALTFLIFSGRSVGLIYFGSAVVLGAGFLFYAIRLFRDGSQRRARELFKFSNYYLA